MGAEHLGMAQEGVAFRSVKVRQGGGKRSARNQQLCRWKRKQTKRQYGKVRMQNDLQVLGAAQRDRRVYGVTRFCSPGLPCDSYAAKAGCKCSWTSQALHSDLNSKKECHATLKLTSEMSSPIQRLQRQDCQLQQVLTSEFPGVPLMQNE